MAKIILNRCFGGYGWSIPGIYAYLEAKGYKDIKFLATIYPKPGDCKKIELDKETFFRTNIRMETETYCGPNDEYVSDLYFETEDGSWWDGYDIPRYDNTAIAVLEEYGSEFCSSEHADLYIEEYDENDFIARIDEYDGSESLELIPLITESRIRACKSVDEIVAFLKRCNAFVRE